MRKCEFEWVVHCIPRENEHDDRVAEVCCGGEWTERGLELLAATSTRSYTSRFQLLSVRYSKKRPAIFVGTQLKAFVVSLVSVM